VSYSLDPRTHTAHKSVGQKVTTYTINGKTVTQAEFETLVEKKKRGQAEILEGEIKEASNDAVLKKKLEMIQTGRTDADPWKKESLGTQTIEGVNAEGARATLTIPAGEIGNTLPIEVVDETWYSPELQIMVMVKHRDPRSAETTYRMTNINRSEPDRSLFEVPADYTVAEGKMSPKPLPKPKPIKEEQ